MNIITPIGILIIAIFDNPKASIQKLSRVANICYSQTYKHLKLLEKRGYIKLIKKGRVNHSKMLPKGFILARNLIILRGSI